MHLLHRPLHYEKENMGSNFFIAFLYATILRGKCNARII